MLRSIGLTKKKKIFIACTGLGTVNRGYETFSQECFDTLYNNSRFSFYLFKGGGKSDFKKNTYRIWNISRFSLFGKMAEDGYKLEQTSFFLAIIPYLIIFRPEVFYYSDIYLGRLLWFFKKIFNMNYKLLLSNGAPSPPPFPKVDFIQNLLPYQLKRALDYGEDPKKHILLPYGFNIEKYSLERKNKDFLRRKLNLPCNKIIIISVGAINRYHKRMDYLIDEISDLNNDQVFFIILGSQEKESFEIIEKGKNMIGESNFLALTVEPKSVNEFMAASDLFVLGSLNEGFGRVLVESQNEGLITIVNDSIIFHEVLGKYGVYIDMRKKGSLKNEIDVIVKNYPSQNNFAEKQNYFYAKFSWENLKYDYISMFQYVLDSK